MRVLVSCLLLLLVAGCSRGGAGWSDSTAADLRQKVEQMFKDIDSSNFAGMKMWADQDAILFDFDENNLPVTARGSAELDKYLAAYDATMRKGLKVHTDIGKDDCFGDSDLGFCAIEFDQSIGASEAAPPTPFKFRGTLVARKTKDGWRWVHWHASFREFPKPAAAAQAAPATTEYAMPPPASQPMTVTPSPQPAEQPAPPAEPAPAIKK